jgi:hypothetical protein
MAAVSSIVIGSAALLGATSSILGGIESKKAGKAKGRAIEAETQESIRLKENEIQDTLANQEVAFAKSGVLLRGTPLDVLRSTEIEGERQKQQILTTGNSQANQARRQGRNAFTQGILSGFGSIANGAGNIAKLGA